MKLIVVLNLLCVMFSACSSQNNEKTKEQLNINKKETNLQYKINKSDDEWRNILTREEFNVLRNKGTEYPNTGEYNLNFREGEYFCKGCGAKLFDSDTKFESHCGWPSFSGITDKSAIKEIADSSHNMIRTEVVCSNCGGHLGHLFDDGPQPSGLRYCINSVSLDFKKKQDEK